MNKEPIEQNIMPEFHLLPRVRDIGSWVVSKLAFIPDLGITHGDHFQKNTGGAPMLDAQLDDQDDGYQPGELTQERLFRVDI